MYPSLLLELITKRPGVTSLLRWQNHPGTLDPRGHTPQSVVTHMQEWPEILNHVIYECFGDQKAQHIDINLLYAAGLYHDLGELLLNQEVLFALKGVEHDLAEYQAFQKYLKKRVSSPGARRYLESAFLLQFVPNYMLDSIGREQFPQRAQAIISNLWVYRGREAQLFMFVEKYEYIRYAYREWKRHKNPVFLQEVFPNQVKALNALVEAMPRLGRVWTVRLRERCEQIVKENGGPITISKTA